MVLYFNTEVFPKLLWNVDYNVKNPIHLKAKTEKKQNMESTFLLRNN